MLPRMLLTTSRSLLVRQAAFGGGGPVAAAERSRIASHALLSIADTLHHPRVQTAPHALSMQSRSVVHIPALVVGSKLLGLFLIKKATVFYLIRQVGITETVAKLRQANNQLFKKGEFNKEMHAQISNAIDLLESGLNKMDKLDKQASGFLSNLQTPSGLSVAQVESLWKLIPSTPEFKRVMSEATKTKDTTDSN